MDSPASFSVALPSTKRRPRRRDAVFSSTSAARLPVGTLDPSQTHRRISSNISLPATKDTSRSFRRFKNPTPPPQRSHMISLPKTSQEDSTVSTLGSQQFRNMPRQGRRARQTWTPLELHTVQRENEDSQNLPTAEADDGLATLISDTTHTSGQGTALENESTAPDSQLQEGSNGPEEVVWPVLGETKIIEGLDKKHLQADASPFMTGNQEHNTKIESLIEKAVTDVTNVNSNANTKANVIANDHPTEGVNVTQGDISNGQHTHHPNDNGISRRSLDTNGNGNDYSYPVDSNVKLSDPQPRNLLKELLGLADIDTDGRKKQEAGVFDADRLPISPPHGVSRNESNYVVRQHQPLSVQEVIQVFGSELPRPSQLNTMQGRFEGEVCFIQINNGDISAHQWSAAHRTWMSLGHFSSSRMRVEGPLANDHLSGQSITSNLPPGTLRHFRAVAKQREPGLVPQMPSNGQQHRDHLRELHAQFGGVASNILPTDSFICNGVQHFNPAIGGYMPVMGRASPFAPGPNNFAAGMPFYQGHVEDVFIDHGHMNPMAGIGTHDTSIETISMGRQLQQQNSASDVNYSQHPMMPVERINQQQPRSQSDQHNQGYQVDPLHQYGHPNIRFGQVPQVEGDFVHPDQRGRMHGHHSTASPDVTMPRNWFPSDQQHQVKVEGRPDHGASVHEPGTVVSGPARQALYARHRNLQVEPPIYGRRQTLSGLNSYFQPIEPSHGVGSLGSIGVVEPVNAVFRPGAFALGSGLEPDIQTGPDGTGIGPLLPPAHESQADPVPGRSWGPVPHLAAAEPGHRFEELDRISQTKTRHRRRSGSVLDLTALGLSVPSAETVISKDFDEDPESISWWDSQSRTDRQKKLIAAVEAMKLKDREEQSWTEGVPLESAITEDASSGKLDDTNAMLLAVFDNLASYKREQTGDKNSQPTTFGPPPSHAIDRSKFGNMSFFQDSSSSQSQSLQPQPSEFVMRDDNAYHHFQDQASANTQSTSQQSGISPPRMTARLPLGRVPRPDQRHTQPRNPASSLRPPPGLPSTPRYRWPQ